MNGNITQLMEEIKGFGFILGEDKKDYFFHMSSLRYCSWAELEEGDAVVFQPTERNGRKVAINVQKYFGEEMVEPDDIGKAVSTYAGIHPCVNLESFSEEERSIIRTFGAVA